MKMLNTASKIFRMFDRIDDVVYEPVKLVCDVLRQPLKQLDAHNDQSKAKQEQKLKKDLEKFETDLEFDKKEREMKLTIEQMRLEEEVNQMVLDNDLARRKNMIQMEVKYRKEMAEAAAQLTQIMANIQVEARDKVLELYTEKIKEYLDLQANYKKDLYNSIKDLKEMFPDGSCDDIIKDELGRQLACIADRSTSFSKLMNEDMKNIFGIIDESVKEMSGLAAKYFQPAQPNQPALTQNVVNSISSYD